MENQATIDPAQGFCICICSLPDGTFNTSVEPLDPQEEQSETSPGTPAKSFDEAIAAAQQLYAQTAGEQQGEAESPQEDQGEGFEQGFNQVRGNGL